MPIIDKYEHINNLNAVVDFHEFKKNILEGIESSSINPGVDKKSIESYI